MSTARLERNRAASADLLVRSARTTDYDAILALLRSLDLDYPGLDLSCFRVAEADGELVGTAELKEGPAWALLSCVGVRPDFQKSGIGRALVEHVCREARSPVYLYTLVPEFFRKAGFRDANSLPADLPPRTIYGCSGCSPRLCRCLVRRRHDS